MKKFALLGLALAASAAMAAGPILVNGTSSQTVYMFDSITDNLATGENAKAQQSLASNAGRVSVFGGASSEQSVSAIGSSVFNTATANTRAIQSLSSNLTDVTITGTSTQFTGLTASSVFNDALGFGALAMQSLSSNVGEVTINGASVQTTSLFVSSAINAANGANTLAVQNIASNNGCVGVSCY